MYVDFGTSVIKGLERIRTGHCQKMTHLVAHLGNRITECTKITSWKMTSSSKYFFMDMNNSLFYELRSVDMNMATS